MAWHAPYHHHRSTAQVRIKKWTEPRIEDEWTQLREKLRCCCSSTCCWKCFWLALTLYVRFHAPALLYAIVGFWFCLSLFSRSLLLVVHLLLSANNVQCGPFPSVVLFHLNCPCVSIFPSISDTILKLRNSLTSRGECFVHNCNYIQYT